MNAQAILLKSILDYMENLSINLDGNSFLEAEEYESDLMYFLENFDIGYIDFHGDSLYHHGSRE